MPNNSHPIGTLPETGYVRQSQLIPVIFPFSPATLWRKVKAGTFPKPVKLGPRITAWRVEDSFADSEQSWSIDVKGINQTSFDLSVKNPNKAEEEALRNPQDIIDEIVALDSESASILEGIRGLL